MNRRDLIRNLGASVGVLSLPELLEGQRTDPSSKRATKPPQANVEDVFQLDKKLTRAQLATSMSDGSSQLASVPALPHVYLYYDPQAEVFIDPTKVVPILETAKYSLDVELRSFAFSTSSFDLFQSVDTRDLQLSLNITAPQTSDEQDSLSW